MAIERKSKKRILIIAGSDSGGCAGIQADLRITNLLGCHGATVITAITAQNTARVDKVFPIPPSEIYQQAMSVIDDIGVDAIKIGMLFDIESMKALQQILQKIPGIPVVLDPVIVATSGARLLQKNAISFLLDKLIPLATLITPNQQEYITLFNHYNTLNPIDSKNDFFQIANCLITGGDNQGIDIEDVLHLDGVENPITFKHKKIDTKNTHGSGCSLSTCIACYLSIGVSLTEAVFKSINLIQTGITNGAKFKIGNGTGPLCFDGYNYHQYKLPVREFFQQRNV